MIKTIILNLMKLAITSGLIWWLITSEKLDFKLLLEICDYPLVILSSVSLIIANFVLISYRWEIILRSRSKVILPIKGLLKITWIGQFFSSVLPGSVSGDLIKIFYVQQYDQSFSKKFIFASILLDRIMGLSGLIFLVGASSIIFGKQIVDSTPSMLPLLKINFILMILVIGSLAVFFFFNQKIRNILTAFRPKIFPQLYQKIILLWDDLVLIKSQMLKAIGLSIIVQFLGVLVFWSLISPFIEGKMSFFEALAFIPLGLMTLALPIAPGGLGVGHAIFQELFELSGLSNGASLFNLYFVMTMALNLLGAIPYLATRAKGQELATSRK